MRAVERAEAIVLALRDSAAMVEEDARAFLAEHDAEVREAALAEGVGLLRRQAARRLGRPEHSAGLRQGAALLHRLADRPAPETVEPGEPAFFQPSHHYTTGRNTFRCLAIDLHPVTGEVYAIGWYRDRVEALSLDDYDQLGWTDITEVTP